MAMNPWNGPMLCTCHPHESIVVSADLHKIDEMKKEMRKHQIILGLPTPRFSIGDEVIKDTGDYHYKGIVVGVITKLSGAMRYVVENTDGMLFIFNGKQLKGVNEQISI